MQETDLPSEIVASATVLLKYLCCLTHRPPTFVTEAIFVFGHIDPRVAEEALEVWKEQPESFIILTGKGRRPIPGFATEASFYADILRQAGVPSHRLILEETSTNSLENVRFGRAAYEKAGISPRSLTVCAYPALRRRSLATIEKQLPWVRLTIPAKMQTSLAELLTRQRLPHLLGEFDRFEEYVQRGDIAPITIPPEVHTAEQLVRRFCLDNNQPTR